MPEMTPEHLAKTLVIAKRREREKCIAVIEDMLDGSPPRDPWNAIAREALGEAIKRIRLTGGVRELTTPPPALHDELPPEREIPDDVESSFLARRFGRFEGQ